MCPENIMVNVVYYGHPVLLLITIIVHSPNLLQVHLGVGIELKLFFPFDVNVFCPSTLKNLLFFLVSGFHVKHFVPWKIFEIKIWKSSKTIITNIKILSFFSQSFSFTCHFFISNYFFFFVGLWIYLIKLKHLKKNRLPAMRIAFQIQSD